MSTERLRVRTPKASKSRSRGRQSAPTSLSRQASIGSVTSGAAFLPEGPQDILLPEGQIGEETLELLQEFVHPHRHETEDTLFEDPGEEPPEGDGEDDLTAEQEWKERKKLPWWKRPSPWWFLTMLPFTAMTMGGTLAPKVEIFTRIACKAIRPEYVADDSPADVGVYRPLSSYPEVNSSYLTSDTISNLTSRSSVSLLFLDNVPRADNDTLPNPKLCQSDPEVEAAVAKLSVVLLVVLGTFAFITTAWWSSLSDRYGRVFVMKITMVGHLIDAVNFIFVTLYSDRLPGGYWFFLVGALADAFVGSFSTSSATLHAYLADCTEPGTRSRVFSLQLGFLFLGMALGPTLGGLLIRFTGDLLSVFYAALAINTVYALFVWFVIPESLTKAQMVKARHALARELAARDRDDSDGVEVSTWERVKRLFGFLSPLSVFVPRKIQGVGGFVKGRKRDWNLTLAGASYGCVIIQIGAYMYKLQYAAAQFGWTAESLGYWLSLVGAARAFHLTVSLPFLISIFKPKATPAIQLPVEESEPLSPTTAAAAASASILKPSLPPPPSPSKHSHSPSFDLKVAKISLIIELVSYVLMPLAPNAALFTVAAMFGAFGTGFGPSIQSIAIEVYTRQGGVETGRLFGATSVVQAMFSQIIGPAFFGLTYMKTVAFFPQAIFLVSSVFTASAFVMLWFIRLPKEEPTDDVEDLASNVGEGHARDDTLVEEEEIALLSERDGTNKGYRSDI